MENNNKRVVDNRQNINDDEKMKINMRAELDEHYAAVSIRPSACILYKLPFSVTAQLPFNYSFLIIVSFFNYNC